MKAQFGDRSLFPTLSSSIYLNHAAVSPLSTPVRWAAQSALDDLAAFGVGAVGPWMERRGQLRQQVAGWLGAQPDDIGFPPGTTRGIIDVALAIPWRSGDRIIVFDGEFPSNVRPWHEVAARFDLRVTTLPLDDGLGALEAALADGGVRLVAVSAVQFQTGLRMPIATMAERCHARGAELFVDAIQALGICPCGVELGYDYLVAGTHKWLMGLDGLAIAYAAPRARERLRPMTAGWLSTEEPLRFLFEGEGHLRYDRPVRRSLDWMEGGVQTTAPFAALAASLSLLQGLGGDAVFAHAQAWHDAVEPALLSRGFTSARATDPAGRSGTLSVRPPPGAALAPLAQALGARGVAVSTPDGWLRLAPHWPNHVGEVEPFVAALDEALRAAC